MESFTWSRCLKQPPKEFKLTTLKIIEGHIPKSLRGVLYRNGPSRLERGGRTVGHWFDGDGAVLGIWFDESGASAMYKFVHSDFYEEEERAGEYIHRSFDTNHEGFFSKLFKSNTVKNAANTSILPLPDRLLTLYEGDHPYKLDLKTFEFKGSDNLGFLQDSWNFSAHPKIDPDNGDIYNFGQHGGRKTLLMTYRMDKHGKFIAKNGVEIDGPNFIHDCVLAGRYLVVFNFALELGLVQFLLGLKTFHQALEWKPENGTEIFIFNKEDLSLVSRFKIKDAFFSYHFSNGYEEKDGNLVIDFIKYADWNTVDSFVTRFPASKDDPSIMKDLSVEGKMTRIRLDSTQGKVLELTEVSDVFCEFPTGADSVVGKSWRYTLFACHTGDYNIKGEWFKGIGRHDRKENKVITYYFGEHRYVNEPILVEYEEGNGSEEGFILTQVYDAKEDSTEIWIHKSEELEKGPICKIQLPETLPLALHAKWVGS